MPRNESPYKSPTVFAETGISNDPAAVEHQHPLLDDADLVTLESPYVSLSTAPVRLYIAADWVVLEGILNSAGALAPVDTDVLFILPELFRPIYTHTFLATAREDYPAGAAFVDIVVNTNGNVVRSDPSVVAGTTKVVDMLDLHGLNWRTS